MRDGEDAAGAATQLESLRETEPRTRPSHPEPELLARGTKIGRYRLLERLGAGAMGVVWAAYDPQLDRRIAIKVLNPNVGNTPEAAGRLLREARAMAKLSHRNVITVHDAGDIDGRLFIAMELVEGTTLGAMLRGRARGEPIDWRTWLGLLIAAGRGLEAAHAQGVLHRDFKPDNVLVDGTGRACVGDFGVALLADQQPPVTISRRATTGGELTSSSDLTTTGALLGTPLYMSPQQLNGLMIDARADQYSFCVTAWEALYGERPFIASGPLLEAVTSLLDQIQRGQLPATPADSHVPASVRAILARGLAADPTARWPDLGALLAALDSATRPRKPWLRRWWPVLAGVTVVGAAALVLALRHHPAPPEPVRLLDMSLRTVLALSSDGHRIGLGGELLQVRELDGEKRTWTQGIEGLTIGMLELEGDSVRFSYNNQDTVWRWNYATTGEVSAEINNLGGEWRGRTVRGELVYRKTEYAIVDHGHEVLKWPIAQVTDSVSISPNRERLAYLDAGRFDGALVVRDLVAGTDTRTELHEPTAVTWADDKTLLYATGTLEHPTIYRASFDGKALGEAREIFARPQGWFGQLWARGATLLFSELRIATRAKFYSRDAENATVDLDSTKVGATLGWVGPKTFLAWAPLTNTLERRSVAGIVEPTSLAIDGEPANATFSDQLLIVATRRPGGRDTAAIDMTSGKVAWRRHDALAVRCAGDAHPPCYAILSEPRDHVVAFDPVTGTPGAQVYARPPGDVASIEDIAVSGDGARLAIGGRARPIIEITPTGTQLSELTSETGTVRSLAYDPQGGLLLAGTTARNRYHVGTLREKLYRLGTSDNEMLSLVRPSPDGLQVLVVARRYEPSVYRLELDGR